MKRVTALIGAAAIALSAVTVLAQAKPNFAGKWTMDAPAAPAAPPAGAPAGGGGGGGRGGRGGGGWGMSPTITQDATTLTIEYTQGENPVKLVYKLDGTESKNMMMGRGGQTEQVSKAMWNGDKLMIHTTTAAGEQVRTISLDGGKLVIETSNPGRDGGPATTSKVTYSKS